MGAYEKFAQVYDLFMDNIDYEEWADYITDHLKRYGIEDSGTGTWLRHRNDDGIACRQGV